jgi:hypothetical protein
MILLLTPLYVPQQYFWGLSANCLALVTTNLSMPCLYYVHVSEWLIFVMQQHECFSTPRWSFTIGRFLWAVLKSAAIWTLFMWKETTISFPALKRLCDYPLLKISEAFLSIIGFMFLFLSYVICEALVLLWNGLYKMAVTFSMLVSDTDTLTVYIDWVLLCVCMCVI